MSDFFKTVIGILLPFAGTTPVSYTHLDVYKRQAEIILQIPFGKNFISCKIIKGGQQVTHTKDSAEQNNKFPLFLFPDDTFLRKRELLGQLLDHIGITGMVFSIVILIALSLIHI